MIRVVTAILQHNDRILLCQRKRGSRYELKWEFPGGKVEDGETNENALQRELKEELCIEFTSSVLLRTEQSDYSDGGQYLVSLYHIESWTGSMHNNVFEQIEWVLPRHLLSYDVLEGNITICRDLPALLHL